MDLVGGDVHHACCGAGDEHLIAYLEGIGLDGELRHAQFGEVFHSFADIDLAFGGVGTVVFVPLAHELALIVAIPETAVEDGGKAFVPGVFLFFCEVVVEYRLNRLFVALHDGIDVFRSSRATFYFKYPDTSLHHFIDETDCF